MLGADAVRCSLEGCAGHLLEISNSGRPSPPTQRGRDTPPARVLHYTRHADAQFRQLDRCGEGGWVDVRIYTYVVICSGMIWYDMVWYDMV